MTDDTATAADIGEHALIARIRERAGTPPSWVALGIGDDAAVLEPERGSVDVVTTDSLIEGVHFRLDWTRADAVGYKALAVNVSDLAAMGASPRAALLSLALPPGMLLKTFDALIDGFMTEADRLRVPLVGGNLARSPGPVVVDVTLIGAARRRRILTRAGGRPGDELYLTGQIGGAAAGLAMLQAADGRTSAIAGPPAVSGASPVAPAAQNERMSDADARACRARYERPTARLRPGLLVARNRAASAAIDLSDGLADAVDQLARASGIGAVIEAEALPVHPGALAWAGQQGADPAEWAASGGEDYELLFAVPARRRKGFLTLMGRQRDLEVSRIGRLTKEPGTWMSRAGALSPLPTAFRHF